MPQFDFYSFSGQSFWLLITFAVFYFFTLYFYIPIFSEVLKFRQKMIRLNLNSSTKEFSIHNLKVFFEIILKKIV